MTNGRGWVVACVLALLAPQQAQAFGTISKLGQNVEHERITRQGLGPLGFGPLTLDEIAGKKGTFGAVGAPDRPNRGLMSLSEAHCERPSIKSSRLAESSRSTPGRSPPPLNTGSGE